MKTVRISFIVWSLLSSVMLWWSLPGSLLAQTGGNTGGVYITIDQLPVDEGGIRSIAEHFFGTSSVENPVEISLDNPGNKVATIDMVICDDENYLLLTGCEITDRTAGFLCRSGESEVGCSEVSLFSMNPFASIAEGSGPIFTLLYEVAEGAPGGECRNLIPQDVFATDLMYSEIPVGAAQGQFCFAAEPGPNDSDGDGVDDGADNCVNAFNPGQADEDGDGVGDICDNCPALPNSEQTDEDGDAIGNACDNCPLTANADQADCDGNGSGDACDCADSDEDGLCCYEDSCPSSNLDATVAIEDCRTAVANEALAAGCTMNDLIASCAEEVWNHGMFVFCVAHLTNQWKREGLITGKDKGAIQSCAAQSKLPRTR